MSPELLTYLMGAAIVGLVADHIAIRTKLATHVTADQMRQVEQRITDAVSNQFTALHAELGTLSKDLAFLKGSMSQQQTGG